MELKGKIENTMDKVQKKGEILNKDKLANLITKYKTHKQNFVKIFRYNAREESTSYGNVMSLLFPSLKTNILLRS